MSALAYAAMHAGICNVPLQRLLARYFEPKMELIRALQLIKLNSVSTGIVAFFCKTTYRSNNWSIMYTSFVCIVLLNPKTRWTVTDAVIPTCCFGFGQLSVIQLNLGCIYAKRYILQCHFLYCYIWCLTCLFIWTADVIVIRSFCFTI